MSDLKRELLDFIVRKGATRARVTIKERLEGPPSSDPTYVLPEARSVIAYFVALDRDFIPDYFGKVSRLPFRYIMYNGYQLVGAIGREMVGHLNARGYKAFSPSPNGVYRPGVSSLGFLVPDFSHRYAALASGLAVQGWSGNVLTPGHWAAAFYGSVITDAELEPDNPSDEEVCDKCKLCTLVCPPQFFLAKESQTVTLGGREYTCARKRNHLRCGISCAGFAGLSKDEKWSSWSTGPVRTPDNKEDLLKLWEEGMKDPANAHIVSHIFPTIAERDKGPGVLLRRQIDTNPTCCNCLWVCSGPREWREKLVKLLHVSGRVVWEDNQEVVKNRDREKSEALIYELKKMLPQVG